MTHAGSRCSFSALVIVLDVTIVGVALPSIRADLGFSEESLAWVVNAYLITFGGAVVSAVSLSLMMTLFIEPAERAKAMGVFGFVSSGGGSLGVLLGLGTGTVFNPVLLAAMGDVEPNEAGLASGLVNTSFMLGGALGLAVLASLAASRTSALLAHGQSQAVALTGGYHVAFLVARSPRRPPLRWAPSCFAPRRRRPLPNR
jgi:MFS family permease